MAIRRPRPQLLAQQAERAGRRVLFSCCSQPALTFACQRLEVENDLVARYFEVAKDRRINNCRFSNVGGRHTECACYFSWHSY
jgi:hypothetical protein